MEKTFLLITIFGLSFYSSFFFGTGLLLAYLGTKIFHDKLIITGKVNSIFLKLGKNYLHFHHWIIGLLIFILFYFFNFFFIIPKIFLGAPLGIALHDFIYDKNWRKVLIKK